MKKRYGEVSAYFAVEAALIMPIVLGCYLFIILMMIYIYECCVWENNAYRLNVWKVYVDGFAGSDPSVEEISEEKICEYLLDCLNKEEKEKYLLGQRISAQITHRGGYMKIDRKVVYPQLAEKEHEITVSCMHIDPTAYLRTVILMKNMGREENDSK